LVKKEKKAIFAPLLKNHRVQTHSVMVN